MVRTTRWKLNYDPGHGEELYDLENDPREERNLAAGPALRETALELRHAVLADRGKVAALIRAYLTAPILSKGQ